MVGDGSSTRWAAQCVGLADRDIITSSFVNIAARSGMIVNSGRAVTFIVGILSQQVDTRRIVVDIFTKQVDTVCFIVDILSQQSNQAHYQTAAGKSRPVVENENYLLSKSVHMHES